jgi:hypothetical protein
LRLRQAALLACLSQSFPEALSDLLPARFFCIGAPVDGGPVLLDFSNNGFMLLFRALQSGFRFLQGCQATFADL